ncbi:hypothetical protein TIFTF001_023707 [Ficus carica]|uniref:Uncharacterized protein n=1 Tax=Ficus carica TaxID=3494 RepID=A0AA88AM70_FICCA|nr:hypothetical protein TIFTF001_023707 [Ficus carica]
MLSANFCLQKDEIFEKQNSNRLHRCAKDAAPEAQTAGHDAALALPPPRCVSCSSELIAHIKKDGTVLPRIGALIEMNLEFFAIDSQGFITNNERALEELFGDEEDTRKGVACLNVMATCIATVFASLRSIQNSPCFSSAGGKQVE